MIIYENIYTGDDVSVAEQRNFVLIVEKLSQAKKNNQSFYLISSSIVFDRKIPKIYTEDSVPNSKFKVAKFLIEAEKKVLDYPKGNVFRVQDLITNFIPLFEKIVSYEGEPVFSNEKLHFLSKVYCDFLINKGLLDSFGDEKLVHFSVPTIFEPSLIWFLIRNGDYFSVDFKKPNFVIGDYQGSLFSKVLEKDVFYKEYVLENEKQIMKEISGFRKGNV